MRAVYDFFAVFLALCLMTVTKNVLNISFITHGCVCGIEGN